MSSPSARHDLLAENLRAFRQAVPWGADLALRLEGEGCRLTSVMKAAHHSWQILVEPPAALIERFGIAPELQLVVTGNQVQARDLQRAAHDASQADGRVNADLVVVVSSIPDLAGHLGRLPALRLAGQSIVQQRVAWPWPSGSLGEHLARGLPLQDLFDVTDPVHRAGHFGRKDELAVLCGQIRNGGAIGVFGLRKVGKTTLARLAEAALKAEGAKCAWVDAQAIPHTKLDGRELARRWAEALPGAQAGRGRDPIEQLIQGISAHLSEDRGVLLTVDEFDLLFEPDRSGAGLLELFGRLRALSQSAESGRLAVVFIGRDPRLITAPLLGGSSNPLLAWVHDNWVGPMERHAATEMLRKLGKRCNLSTGHKTTARAWAWSGGHPLLQRQFGSAALSVMRVMPVDGMQPLSTDPHLDEIERAFRRRQRCRDVGAEVVALLGDHYPAALALLRDLAAERERTARRTLWDQHGEGDLGPSQVLREFGLVRDDLEVAEFWAWYLRVMSPPLQERMVG